jgi:hypothetical protein
MTIAVQQTPKGELALVSGLTRPIGRTADFLDLLASTGAPTLALRKEDLAAGFFTLRTGIAGELLQKVSNYRRRLIVIGDFDGIKKKSLRDFIRESNRTGMVVFAASLEAALDMLA